MIFLLTYRPKDSPRALDPCPMTDNSGWDACDDGVGGDVCGYDCAGPDDSVITDAHSAEHNCPSPDEDTLSDLYWASCR